MAFTFRANSFRLLSVAAAWEKPAVSPQPPIAIMTAVPGGNFDRTVSTVVKRGQEDGTSGELKISERMKASATCVISDTRRGSGTTLCCLEVH